RQSDIPEIPELTWLLTCVTAKGLMNRAHAYKASVDQNELAGNEPDDGVTMGLFSYPILMAADILIFNANKVPVGRDQVQHIEMARDVAQRFNHLFGNGRQFFVLPEAAVDEAVATLPGLDGRKMSKSYDNTVPLFEGGAKGLREAIARIVTDSRLPGEPKDPDSTSLTALFDAFATPAEREAFRADLRAGLGWGDAKQRLVEQLEREIAPMRARYEELVAHPAKIEEALQEGARKARALATPLLAELRQAVGLRPMIAAPTAKAAETAKAAAKPVFKQYREADGRFYFKLTDPQGRLLLQSEGFDGGRDAGQWVGRLKNEGAAALAGAPVQAAEGVTADEIAAALASFAEE
ncbi:tryptophan--tRNA ligase, partial [Niveibacterium sp.]|uniref:tryptophan--tRNA ligase n=1 Tax=Niveibacterium sp. TaxID=2017444 RepID=UPI0035AE9CD0